MHPPVCATCHTPATDRADPLDRRTHQWCQRCNHYLSWCPHTCGWVSPAQQLHNARERDSAAIVSDTRRLALANLAMVAELLPAGWAATVVQVRPGATYSVHLDPPLQVADATAYLRPPYAGAGWYVRVHNRATGVDFPLYTAGGLRAAEYDHPADAVAAAVNALHIEAGEQRRRQQAARGRW